MRVAILVIATTLMSLNSLGGGAADTGSQVEKSGQEAKIRLEQIISGNLKDLNGRYKLRVTEVTYEPGGYIGAHHHVGPGIRCLLSGELTYEESGKTTLYRSGDCFYESGDVTHTAHNRTTAKVVLLNFEILPADWSGSSATPVT